MAKATKQVKRIPSGQDKYKGLTKELNWYLETSKKSNNLERLYQLLFSISPSSVAVEKRLFSTSGLLNQRRAVLNDYTLDDTVFLKYYYALKNSTH